MTAFPHAAHLGGGPIDVRNLPGDAQPGVAVAVYLAGTTTPAVLFADRDRAVAVANPVTSGIDGTVNLWCDAPGEYDVIAPGMLHSQRFTAVRDDADTGTGSGGGGGPTFDDSNDVPLSSRAPAPIGATAVAGDGTASSADNHVHTASHTVLSGVSADQHHAQAHAHDGTDGSGTVAHAATTGQGTDDHHPKAHTHNGSDGSGTVAGPAKVGVIVAGTTYGPEYNLEFTSADANSSWVAVDDAAHNKVTLALTVTGGGGGGGTGSRVLVDAVTNSTTTLTSESGAFTVADVGRSIVNGDVPAATIINSVTDTKTVVLSKAATASHGRKVTDGVLNSTTTVTSATAAFVSGDVGKNLAGTGIPFGATIVTVTNSTTVVISLAATATATGVTLTVAGSTTTIGAPVTSRLNFVTTGPDPFVATDLLGANARVAVSDNVGDGPYVRRALKFQAGANTTVNVSDDSTSELVTVTITGNAGAGNAQIPGAASTFRFIDPNGGNDLNDGRSWGTAYKTIRAALYEAFGRQRVDTATISGGTTLTCSGGVWATSPLEASDVGSSVTGTGVVAGTVISSVNAGAGTAVLSKTCTNGTVAVTITASPVTQGTGKQGVRIMLAGGFFSFGSGQNQGAKPVDLADAEFHGYLTPANQGIGGVHLIGLGRGTTMLERKSGDVCYLRMRGTPGDVHSAVNHIRDCFISDLTITDSSPVTNAQHPLIKWAFVSQCGMNRVNIGGCDGCALSFVETFDTQLNELYIHDAGSEGAGGAIGPQPAVLVQCGAYDGDTPATANYGSNNLWFQQFHIENFYAGGLWFVGVNGASTHNKCRLFGVKLENHQVRGQFLRMKGCKDFAIYGLNCTGGENSQGSQPVGTWNCVELEGCQSVHMHGLYLENVVGPSFIKSWIGILGATVDSSADGVMIIDNTGPGTSLFFNDGNASNAFTLGRWKSGTGSYTVWSGGVPKPMQSGRLRISGFDDLAGAATPTTAVGFIQIVDSGGTLRKVAYY